MVSIEQKVLEGLRSLPAAKQSEVLDFVEFLRTRLLNQKLEDQNQQKPTSALDAAGDLVGCLDGGPPDLSTNKQYLEGFGEE